MAETRSPNRRKARMVRDEPVPADTVVVVRAAASDRTRTLRNAVLDAIESGSTYVITHADGSREVLYGISVFARRAGQEVADTLRLFVRSPHCLELTVGDIRAAGFDVVATGSNPDHYDVQLVPGRIEGEARDATVAEVRGAASRFLWAAGDLASNPAYAGESPQEDDR